MRSSRKDLSVYDFSEEDEVVESASKGLMKRFMTPRNPSSDNSPLTKYSFLQCFAQGGNVQQVEINDVLCVDIDGSNGDGKCNNFGSYSVGTSARVFPMQEDNLLLDNPVVSTSTTNDEKSHIGQDEFEPGNLIPECEKPVAVISDDDESLEVSSQSTSSSYLAEDEGAIGHPTSDDCSSDHREMEVVIFPDYLSYGDSLFTRSQLTFFTDHIKLEDLNECESSGSASLEWATDNLIHIECQQSESVETALVKLRLRPNDVVGANEHGTSGIVKLEFAVSGPQWQEKEQMITSLAAVYKARWNSMLNPEIATEEDDFMGQNSMFFLKRYFSNFDEPFEDVVYPKGDPDAVSLSKRDVELLQPGTFINDTIIDFYVKYLQNKIRPEDKHRFHFFNSFFFRKLVDLDKDPKSAFEGRAAFQRVHKWTRKVNIFEKDYIFIPVNFNLHWSLIVICYPGEVVSFKDEEIKMAPKVPCILHMDSIKGSHQGLKNLVQSYLWEEWKERHKESSKSVSLKFLNLRFVPLELPQQENSFDCGLFLLHYVELFLEEAPVNFSPFKITKFSNFLSVDWFPPIEASHKRSAIQRLIYELLNDRSLKIPPAACSNQHHRSKSPENNAEKEHAVEFLSEQCNPSRKGCFVDSVCSTSGRVIDIKLLAPSSPDGDQNDKGTGVALQDFLGQGAVAGSCPSRRYQPFDQIDPLKKFQCTMSPIQEDEENSEQLASSPLDKVVAYRLPARITAIECTTYSSKDVGAFEVSLSQDISTQPEHNNGDSLSESSSCGSPHSSELRENKHSTSHPSRYFTSSKAKEEAEKVRSVSPTTCAGDVPEIPIPDSSNRLEDCIVDDSQEEADAAEESKDTGDSLSSCPKIPPSSFCQDIEPSEDDNLLDDDAVQLISDGLDSRSRRRGYKRSKLVPPEGGRRRTRSCTRF
ncbi:probable ubiquitin-like-specific protease 2B isoform X2 [Magnolia sinica]|uniref:probable ubiquitin-like-specific protease 2B isoform X2 n=1 Tax=Magnolia sinica TaxID=86752 RepID=UPI002658F5FB|nr:probable ubiquitin-like-specific protease 2B isoform X2 [Magnolia sinica]